MEEGGDFLPWWWVTGANNLCILRSGNIHIPYEIREWLASRASVEGSEIRKFVFDGQRCLCTPHVPMVMNSVVQCGVGGRLLF